MRVIFLLDTKFTLRLPPKEVMDEYLNSPRYVYDRTPVKPDTLFEQIVRSVIDFIDWILYSTIFGENSNYYQIAALLLIAAGVFYILNKKMYLFTAKSDFAGNRESSVDISVHETDTGDLDKLEEKYLSEGNNRGLLRVLYIKYLRILAEKNMLRLDTKKTNWEYASELRDKNLQVKFIKLTMMFENSWYGGFNVSAKELEYFRSEISSGAGV